jgi:uncharacterized LabA/DUF88 family protein
MQREFAFIDGSYLRADAAKLCGTPFIDIRALITHVISERGVREGRIMRTCYYDAEPREASEPIDPDLTQYWRNLEQTDDVELRFGHLRARTRKSPRQQKGVDVLLAVDLVVGAFNRIFDAAILVAGDADFVPAAEEVKRRGIIVILAAFGPSVSEELARICDRVYVLDSVIHGFTLKMATNPG